MKTEITETQKRFNDVAKKRHLNLDNIVLTALSLCADNPNKQLLTDEEKDINKIQKGAI